MKGCFVKREGFVAGDEEGFVLVLSLLMLVILTLLGITAGKNTSFELNIAGNGRAALDVFYVAESGWMRGFQWIENWGSSSAPPLINGINANANLPLVAQVDDQSQGATGIYSYTIARSSSPTKVPGNSKQYLKFLYSIESNATGKGGAACRITVGVEKISK